MAAKFELYYGGPGTAKTRSIIRLIEHMREKSPGKIARVYVGDGSAEMYRGSGLVEEGVIELMEFAHRPRPFTVCQQICEGWWPESDDPTSKMRKLTAEEMAKTALSVFEGASVMGAYMMGDQPGGLAQRAADGEIIGQDANVKINDGEGYAFGGNSPAHYGLGQKHLHANMMRTKIFPGWVIWTAHERIDDGERGGGLNGVGKVKVDDKIIGPELIGKALTSNIARDFGNTLHFTLASKKVPSGTDPLTGKTNYVEKADYRIYTRDHYDPDGIVALKYRAVCRVSGDPDKVKDYYSADKPGDALLQFYSDLAAANKRD